MPNPAANFRRLFTQLTTGALCAVLASVGVAPVAQAADARELLAGAIAGTKGTYLVYNFGGGNPAPMMNAAGDWYDLTSGGHLMIIKNASQRLTPKLLVDSHRGYQSRCERDPRARTGEGLMQASETFSPLQAWQALGKPTIAINANFFDIRGQTGGSWKTTGCSSPLGVYVDNTTGQGRVNAAVTGNVSYAGKQGLSGGNENWIALTTMILPVGGVPYAVWPSGPDDFDAASSTIEGLLAKESRFVAVSGFGLLAPGHMGQMNDPGPSAARTAIGYSQQRDEMYIFQGGNYTLDNMQDLFRALGSDVAIGLDGGGSSSIVLRRDTGGMWAGAGVPKGSCDTMAVLCDSHERALPSWLAFS